ncbi:hypothetical protein C2S53_016156 [Perilla frutescens var. hirtella]|uniref:Peptidase A1 domain-containing protein n=1 Tax=Perilla frutescens var. hirtella TaxID=608512 RepID=A0AAD4J5N0_PERFH|nr:hypothetical protein C2S53_016156 [Perilla frutescens var. hirtella]
MNLHKIPLVCAITLIISMFDWTEAAGFSIDLIHRDSLQSPSLHSSTFENVGATLRRSSNRAKTLIQDHDESSSPQSASADIVPDQGEYLMRFAIGTPKVETLAIADTGSDLTWIQCLPCLRCFKQKAPFFAPKRSSTYKPLTCSGSGICNSLQSTSCNRANGTCTYTITYGDNSYSKGDVATETITLGSTSGNAVAIPNVIIGCGHIDQGTFGAGASGIVGLGGGKESLVRQMGSSIGGKFSYCLIPLVGRTTKPSKMHFGDEAVISGAGVVTTPIVAKSPATFYYLTLEGVSVGNQRFNLEDSSSSWSSKKAASEGNIIIDSGTTLTYLPSEIYNQVEAAVKKQVSLKRINDPQEQLNLCYLAAGDADEKKIPEMTAHFKGADVKLKSHNTFVRTSQKSLCFAFVPSTFMAIYGNLAQMDFLIGYDLEKKTVSFKPNQCSNA